MSRLWHEEQLSAAKKRYKREALAMCKKKFEEGREQGRREGPSGASPGHRADGCCKAGRL